MSKNKLLIIIAITSIAAAAFLFALRPNKEEQINPTDAKQQTFDTDISDTRIHNDPTKATHRSSLPQKFNSLESGYRWDQSAPGIAANKQDAEWLDSHGFPGPDVERYLMSLHISTLKNLAESGNKPAQAIYALRLAQSGHQQADTQEVLIKSAASGSIYALKMAGDIYSSVDGYRDPAMASAFYGLQARRGDQAGLSQSYLTDSRLNDDQRFRANVLKELIWRNIDAIRAQGGLRSLESSARPGLSEFLNQAIQSNHKIEQ